MSKAGPEAEGLQTFDLEPGEVAAEAKQRLASVFVTAAALKVSTEKHIDAVNEASKVVPPAGFLFKLVSLEDGAFVQVHDFRKSRSFQPLPAGTEFYATNIVSNPLKNRNRLAVMVAHRPDRETDPSYRNPLIVTSQAFDISLFPETDYEPGMNYAGRFGPTANPWQDFPTGKIV